MVARFHVGEIAPESGFFATHLNSLEERMRATKELTLNKKHLKLAGLLLALLLGVLVIDTLAATDARNAGKTATESVTELFSIDFRRDIAGQLPPYTETGRTFWTTHLATIEDTIKAQGATVQSVQAERSGNPEPYSGLGGEGQIVPVRLTITSLDKDDQVKTAESEIRVLMIKSADDQWLLDGLAVDLPAQ
jgi:hypothetical protein